MEPAFERKRIEADRRNCEKLSFVGKKGKNNQEQGNGLEPANKLAYRTIMEMIAVFMMVKKYCQEAGQKKQSGKKNKKFFRSQLAQLHIVKYSKAVKKRLIHQVGMKS